MKIVSKKPTSKDIMRVKRFFGMHSLGFVLHIVASSICGKMKALNFKFSVGEGAVSQTDGKTVSVSVPNTLLTKKNNELYLVAKALMAHEIQHVLSTDFKGGAEFAQQYGGAFAARHGLDAGMCIQFVHMINNALEDGRIENLLSIKLPGIIKPLQICNLFSWETAEVDGKDELMEFMFSIGTMAVSGIRPQNWDVVYPEGSDMETRMRNVEMDILNATVQQNDCYEETKAVIEKNEDFFANALKKPSEAKKKMQELFEKLKETLSKTSSSKKSPLEKMPKGAQKALAHIKKSENSKDDKDGNADGKSKKSGDKKEKGGSEGSKGEGKEEGEGSEGTGSSGSKGDDEESDGDGDGDSDGDSSKSDGKGSGKADGDGEDSDESETSSGTASDGDGNKDGTNSGTENAENASNGNSQSEQHRKGNDDDAGTGCGGNGESNGLFRRTAVDQSVIDEIMETLSTMVVDANAEIADLERKEKLESKHPKKSDSSDISEEYMAELENKYKDDMYGQLQIRRVSKSNVPLPPALKVKANAFRRDVQKILNGRIKHTVRNQRMGNIDGSRLYSIPTKNYSVFQQKQNPVKLDYVAYILQDGSGSMSSERKHEFASCASAIVEEGLKGIIPLKISVFTVERTTTHYVVKDFDENDNHSYSWSAYNQCGADGGNKDGFSIRVATRELLQRPERDKILFVFSDGLPSDYRGGYEGGMNDVASAVKEARDKGIMVVSAVMGSSDFRESNIQNYVRMYGNNVVSCEPSEMGAKIINVMRKIIRH